MRENPALEKYQKETYNDILATYIFEVETGGVQNEDSPSLEAKKPGIVLHFLRYGVFDPFCYIKQGNIKVRAPYTHEETEQENATQQPQQTTETNGSQDTNTDQEATAYDLEEALVTATRTPINPSENAPELEQGHYGRTGLREGYLYILEEGEAHQWIEYQIDELGALFPIYWEKNKKDGVYIDIRDEVSKTRKKSHTVKPCTFVWVAYSPVQWTIQQIEAIEPDPGKDELMTRIECSGYMKDAAIDAPEIRHHTPYDEFEAFFAYTQDKQAFWLQQQLSVIADVENAPDPDHENTLKEDMFITLHDPMGCADDIEKIIEYKVTHLDAIVQTLKTAQHASDLYDEVLELAPHPDQDKGATSKEETEEIAYIFAMALTTYKFVYNNDELENEYAKSGGEWHLKHGISLGKLNDILAINLRKRKRNVINRYRNDLGNLLQSAHYETALHTCLEGSPLAIVEGKNYCSSHLLMLAHYPAMIDRALLTEREYKPLEDQWCKAIINTTKKKSVFKKVEELLYKEVEITELEQQDKKDWKYVIKFNKKMIDHLKKISKSYVGYGAAVELKMVKSQMLFATRTVKGVKDTYLVIDEGPLIRDHFDAYTKVKANIESKNPIHLKQSAIHHAKKPASYWLKVHESFLNEAEANQTTHTQPHKQASIHIKKSKDLPYGKKIEQIIKGPEFRSTVLVFEIFALTNEFSKGFEQGWNNESKLKAFGASIKTTAAALNLAESLSVLKGNDLYTNTIADKPRATAVEKKGIRDDIKKNSFATKAKGVTKFANVAGSMVTIISSIHDMSKARALEDNDAALAYGGAAVLGGVALAADLGLIALHPVALIIIAGMGLALYGLAYYLTDDALATFFKHYPFSTKVGRYTDSGTQPYYNAQILYENRAALIAKHESKYMPKSSNNTYKNLFVRLINLISGSGIVMKAGNGALHSPRDSEFYLRDADKPITMQQQSEFWKTLSIDVAFGTFLQEESLLTCELYLVETQTDKSYRIPSEHYDTMLVAPVDTADGKKEFKRIRQTNYNEFSVYKKMHIWLRIPKTIEISTTTIDREYHFKDPRYTKKNKSTIPITKYSYIAVLCKYTDGSVALPLCPDNTQGYLCSMMTVHKHAGVTPGTFSNTEVISRAAEASILTKKLFFDTYPLQT